MKMKKMHDRSSRTRESCACFISGRVCEIMVAVVDNFPVNTKNRRRNRENMRLRVIKNRRTSAAMMQGQCTLVGKGASRGVFPVSSPLKKTRTEASQPT